jgi:ubiquinone/menaquinone biosynthesis C-methylase UbiE
VSSPVAAAYSAAAAGWERGPARLYERMAARLVSFAEPLAGKRVLDVGTGSGAAARALVARGALVAATDLAHGMLAERRMERPPATVGDITRLPFRRSAFDVTVAAFVVNHLADPTEALREMARVCRPGGVVLASSFAAGDDPEVKSAVEEVARGFGWSRPSWYAELKASCTTSVETTDQLLSGLRRAGLSDAASWVEVVGFDDLPAQSIASWRLWSPALAPFVEALPDAQRDELIAAATEAARGCPPVSLQMLVGRGLAH